MKLFFRICVILFMLSPPVLAESMKLEVLDLRNRPASEIMPLVKPFLQQGATITGTGFKLILRTTPTNLSEIKKIINKLDTAPMRLMISVKFADDDISSDTGVSVSGKIKAGDASVSAGGPASAGDNNIQVRIHKTTSRDVDSGTFKAQVLEGKIAHIRIGESIPVAERTTSTTPTTTVTQDSIRYKDVTSGFFVRPRVSGTRVIMDISPEKNTLSPHGGGIIDTQRLVTTVNGELGQWIELGGLTEQNRHNGSGIIYSTKSRDSRKKRILIRADEIQ